MVGSSEDGYATPAAALIATAIAIVTIASVSRATSELRHARADFARAQAEYHLAGAHNVALLAIATSSKPPPYRWTVSSLGQVFTVIAEPERGKLSFSAAGDLDDETLRALGVTDPVTTRANLGHLPVVGGLAWAADASAAHAWRACAGALISPYGAQTTPPTLTYAEPESGKDDSNWRPGEVWRVVVIDNGGWRDERIVRFTGNGLNPAATIARRLVPGWKEDLACETLTAAG